ncbi:ScpA family protein [Marinilactibacillus sp. Marseille-P9653]|uniref:segregation and condensation protein A n=1 Tax=Marinilactibacillus sp. Marseille-P9653 TaxID=2866583 RepID=UPI001CE4A19C|nr:segregation/condensation protein A [Marinilactibacillus sp. Marseille-P9653]
MSENWEVNLDVFEGPLDLLLHLINKYEIDIYDIPIARITAQYMDYLHAMKSLQLDVAGEYLVMAATLMSIKSQLLVPRNDSWDEEGEDFIPEHEDPREELMDMLIEYRKFKNAANQLDQKQLERSVFFTKEPADVSEFQKNVPLENGEIQLQDLIDAFKTVMKRSELREPELTTIETEEITVADRMEWIESELRGRYRTKVAFQDLFSHYSRKDIVVTFLALLELIKENKVAFTQEETYSDIELSYIG